ncbi:hypothetical protein [Rhodopirellula bahusiensis]|uniref:hypothetical protein n=4 Tax=Rhodopirellula bahusiensis TaxID=2014065 RepID=UPI003296CC13
MIRMNFCDASMRNIHTLVVWLFLGTTALPADTDTSLQNPGIRRDPTVPSPQIKAILLAAQSVTTTHAPKTSKTSIDAQSLNLRLLGLMLTDSDNGIAIVSLNSSRGRAIPLRRSVNGAERTVLKFDAQTFVLVDFSETSVVFETLSGSSRFVLK